jgi:hypothetical protein
MRSHLPTRKNPLAPATSAAGARDDVGDPTLYVTLNADYVTPGFVKPGFDDDRRRTRFEWEWEGWESKWDRERAGWGVTPGRGRERAGWG